MFVKKLVASIYSHRGKAPWVVPKKINACSAAPLAETEMFQEKAAEDSLPSRRRVPPPIPANGHTEAEYVVGHVL